MSDSFPNEKERLPSITVGASSRSKRQVLVRERSVSSAEGGLKYSPSLWPSSTNLTAFFRTTVLCGEGGDDLAELEASFQCVVDRSNHPSNSWAIVGLLGSGGADGWCAEHLPCGHSDDDCVRFEAHEDDDDDDERTVTHTTMNVPMISTIANRATNQKVSILDSVFCSMDGMDAGVLMTGATSYYFPLTSAQSTPV